MVVVQQSMQQEQAAVCGPRPLGHRPIAAALHPAPHCSNRRVAVLANRGSLLGGSTSRPGAPLILAGGGGEASRGAAAASRRHRFGCGRRSRTCVPSAMTPDSPTSKNKDADQNRSDLEAIGRIGGHSVDSSAALRTMAGSIETGSNGGASSSTDSSNGSKASSVSTSSMDEVGPNTPEELFADGTAVAVREYKAPKPPKKGVPHRWRVVFMMALSFVLCNMDKVNMSVAILPMASELGWTATDRGLVSSAFFWGYSLTQVPAGYLSTRIGGSKVLFAGVLLWSLGTLIAPPAAQVSLLALCATRLFVGLGEGLAPSSVTNIMAQLMPERERARAVTTVFGGLDVGSAVGLLLCGPLIKLYGWPIVFYGFAIIGFIWCALWPLVKPEQPDAEMSEQLRAEAGDDPAESAKPNRESVPWAEFLKVPAVWAVICAHFSFNWGYYTLLAWLPSYFEMALGLNIEKSSLLTLIPYVAMTAMTPLVGPVADGLVQRGWSVTNVRKFAQGIAFAGPMLCMLACARLTPMAGAAAVTPATTALLVGILSLAFGLGAWARAGLYCNHQDISPKYASALLGISNTAGALPGVLGVTAAGYLLDKTGSWASALFLPTAACQLFGLLVYSTFASSEKVKFKKQPKAA